jgi:hypothetical protein
LKGDEEIKYIYIKELGGMEMQPPQHAEAEAKESFSKFEN